VKIAIDNLGKNRVFSDYRVTNPDSGGQYTVAVRGLEVGDNTCTCPDFKSNTLGTCKHIEAVLDHLKDELPPHLQKKKATVNRPEIYLHYGEQLQLGIHLPPRHQAPAGHPPPAAALRQARSTRRPVLRREGPVVRPRPVRGAHRRS